MLLCDRSMSTITDEHMVMAVKAISTPAVQYILSIPNTNPSALDTAADAVAPALSRKLSGKAAQLPPLPTVPNLEDEDEASVLVHDAVLDAQGTPIEGVQEQLETRLKLLFLCLFSVS